MDPATEIEKLRRELAALRAEVDRARAVEDELRRFRVAMDHAPDIILLIDRGSMRFVDANEAACRLLGYAREELLAMGPAEVLPVSRAELEIAYDALIARPGEIGRMNSYYRCKDGSHLPFESTRRILQTANGWLVAVVSRDVRERLAAERALRDSEERFRSLASLSSDWFWEMDQHYRFVSTGLPEGDKTEIRPPDLFNKAPWEHKNTSLSAGEWEAFRARLDARETYRDFTYSRVIADGRTRYVSVSGEPVFDAGGRFRGYRGVGRDVTDQRIQQRLAALEHAVTRCLAGADSVSTVLRQVLRLICESEGWDCGRYFHHDDATGVMRFYQSWSVGGEGIDRFQAASDGLEYRKGVGLVGLAWQSASPVWTLDAMNDPRVAVAPIARDAGLNGALVFPAVFEGGTFGVLSISSRTVQEPDERLLRSMAIIASQVGQFLKRKRAEAAVRQLNQDLEGRVSERTEALAAANRELEAYSYSVSHDLQAPLRAIQSFSSLLARKSEALSGEDRHMLDRIRRNAERMGELIGGLLNFARLSRKPLTRVRVEPSKLVREILEEHASSISSRQISIEVRELPACYADPLLLRQVFSNLIDNALKYSARQEQARIEIGANEEKGLPVYYVRDDGAGFDMQHVDKLFGVFERLHAPTEFEGTGIGLATVRSIVERHGGRIWAHGAPEQGATFSFTLAAEPP